MSLAPAFGFVAADGESCSWIGPAVEPAQASQRVCAVGRVGRGEPTGREPTVGVVGGGWGWEDDAAAVSDRVSFGADAGVESEMELPYAALHQLCTPMLDRLQALPAPQRQTLEIAFALGSGTAADRVLVGLAVLNLCSEAAFGKVEIHRRRELANASARSDSELRLAY